MFVECEDVVVKQGPHGDPKMWTLERELVYIGKQETFRVEAGMETDFASVPKVFVWFLPRYGRYTRPAILHDSLWDRAKAGTLAWRDADAIFRRAMRELKVPFLRRWIMWAAVRWGALAHLGKGSGAGWLKDLPLVLLFTLIAAPIVLPPAVLILAALALFFVYEVVLFVLLAVGRGVKRLFGRRAEKPLNVPTFSWKTT